MKHNIYKSVMAITVLMAMTQSSFAQKTMKLTVWKCLVINHKC